MSQVQLKTTEAKQADQSEGAIILQVSNLTVEFARSKAVSRAEALTRKSWMQAVDNVSFSVKDSEILAIVGESGSGKTTIARCIMCLTEPTQGSIKYRGIEVTKLRGKDLLRYRKEVQVIFQDPFESLNPRHDVLATLSLPLRRLAGLHDKEEIKKAACNLLLEVGLDPALILYRLPHQLSGGQRQRVNIARALASNPKLLIADEPITMLDAAQRLKILSLLSDLREKRNLTILMITHDLASTRIVSDRTLVMYLGRVVELGQTDLVLESPHHPYVDLIMQSMPSLDFETQSAEGYYSPIVGFSSLDENLSSRKGCLFLSRCMYSSSTCSEIEPKLIDITDLHQAACHNPLNKPAN